MNFELAVVVFEFLKRHIGLGLQSGVDDNMVVVDTNDFSGDNFTGAHFRALERFIE